MLTLIRLQLESKIHPTMVDTEPSIACTTSLGSMLASERDPSNTFKDLRSSSKPNQRRKTQSKRYYDYDIVKPGQISQPHHATTIEPSSGYWPLFPADLFTCPTVLLTKKQLYDEAQHTAPFFRRSHSCCCCRKWESQHAQRQEAAAKAEAYDWNKFGCRKDFVGQGAWDHTDYEDLSWQDIQDWYDEEWYCPCGMLDLAHGRCDFYGAYDGHEPVAVFDLSVLVDNAIAGLEAPVKEPGWDGLNGVILNSPEMDWVHEEIELSDDDDDFEWI
jgi:hypothetical protein